MILSKKLKNPFDVLHPRFEKAARKASSDLSKCKIKHVLIGGIAAGAYGRPRATEDIDFLVHTDARGKLLGQKLGGEVEGLTTKYYDVSVDFLFSQKIPQAYTLVKNIPLISPEELVLLKLVRSSHRDLNDIMEIIRGGNLSLDKLRQLANQQTQHVIEKEDLERIIKEALLVSRSVGPAR